MDTPASGAESWLTLNGKPLSFQAGDDNSAVGAVEYPPNMLRVTPNAPDWLEVWVDGEKLETERYGLWYWRPRGFAGIYELTLKAPNYTPRIALVRVLPSRLSYERWEAMLEEIRDTSEDLLFQLQSPAFERARIRSRRERSSALREYQLIKAIQPELADIMARLRRNPRRSLSINEEQMLVHQVPRFSAEVQPVPGPVQVLPAHLSSGLLRSDLPLSWTIQEQTLTYDVYENRLLKHFLWRQLAPRLFQIQERAEAELARREQSSQYKRLQGWEDDETPRIEGLKRVIQDCHDLLNQCNAWGSETFLRHVSSLTLAQGPTQVLQKHPTYNRFYRLYLRFQKELAYSLDTERFLAKLAMRKVSELYQFWAVFVMTRASISLLTRAGYRLISSNGYFELNEDAFQLDVMPGARIELAKDDVRILIRYEPVYPQMNSVVQGLVSTAPRQRSPDMSIEIWEKEQPVGVIVFDAKYKTESDGIRQTYVEDDLTKMSDYLNKIRWKSPNAYQQPRRVVSSAYILYPGEVLEHDPNYPETGALPLVPLTPQSKEVSQAIRQIFKFANLI